MTQSPPEDRRIAGIAFMLERRMHVARAIPVARAALGLRTVLDWWRAQRTSCQVAVPAAVCHEVIVAVLAAHCRPVFCDVDPATGLVPAGEWARARAAGAEVAIVVHLYGNHADVDVVRGIFPAPQCLLIDDAAQALGSSGAGHQAGAGGDVGLVSFGPTKHISTGNAALLFKSTDMAQDLLPRLRDPRPQPRAELDGITSAFRLRLEQARSRQWQSNEDCADEFRGLLPGLERLLDVPYDPRAESATMTALQSYDDAARARIAKCALWHQGLSATALRPVGMAQGCIPWRYVCRLPGIGWAEQHRLSQALRSSGLHVSNWYLPGHWFLQGSASSLPGVETLSREVFQFWLDETTSFAAIERQSAIVTQLIG